MKVCFDAAIPGVGLLLFLQLRAPDLRVTHATAVMLLRLVPQVRGAAFFPIEPVSQITGMGQSLRTH